MAEHSGKTRMEGDKARKPVKLTIEYADGSSESYDTFMAFGAHGLFPIAKKEGDVAYMNGKDFGIRCVRAMYVTDGIVAAFGKALLDATNSLINGDIGMAIQIMTTEADHNITYKKDNTEQLPRG